MKRWGFKYVRPDKVWRKIYPSGKPKASCGPWGMTDVEFLFMGIRGKMCSSQIGKRNQYTMMDADVVEAEHTGVHSGKPAIFRQLIDKRFGDVPRIELFAREIIPGWDAIGNGVDGIDIMESIRLLR
jgi:N6-adenosine-specific RNA methylase IME4